MFGAERSLAIKDKVEKLLKAKCIRPVQYPEWLANVVLVPKSNGKWRLCIDFTDLNKACPKDPFPLPRIDTLADSTSSCEMLSFLDAYQGYNQIPLAPEDQEKASFVTDQGVFCYNVMPFGLKNAGATYQRLVNYMFRNQIGWNMEVYIDDILVKSPKEQDHIKDLEECFQVLKTFGMKLNPAKCTFRVRGGKFLGYMISERGIEANPEKIRAIMTCPHQDKGLPFFKVLRGVAKFEWKNTSQLAFDNLKREWSGVVLESPQGDKFEYAIKLEYPSSNNEAEYEAFLAGGELALAAGARKIVIYSDSQLVVNQVRGSYEARDEKMAKYFVKAKNLLDKFEEASVVQVSRTDNAADDQLAKLASSMSAIRSRKITFISSKSAVLQEQEEIMCAVPTPTSWKEEIVRFLTEGIEPESEKDAKSLRRRASHFVMVDGQLYKRGFSQSFLKCLTPEEGNYVLREIHEGICGNHIGGRALAEKTLRQGFFWPTMLLDAHELVKRCRACQEHANINHQSAALMQPLESPCPFDQWGLDLVGPFPQATGQRKFLIVAVDYFTKWVEAKALAKITEKKEQAQGVVQRTGDQKVLHLGRSTGRSRRTFGEWRVKYYDSKTNAQGIRMNLDLVKEAREKAAVRVAMYKARMTKAYNARVRPRDFQVRDLVMRKVEASGPIGKLDPKWEGPYKVVEIENVGAYKLQRLDGKNVPRTWNIGNLKRYYA
ncbi:UNVERIFIED_CONTAM: Transposon Ty3-G Gag-Pol polyprotein [Sesamum latifolium]|uniref:Transposon Ty3-G Gag-Pol polyprotein n=1 Tax=Sesamum latifolium TaxID=2727402 RepID=A0AAW2UFC6_9LAMI